MLGVLDKLLGRSNKSFEELIDEYHQASYDYLNGRIDENAVWETQFKVLKKAARIAKDDR